MTARTFEVDRTYRFKKGSGLPVRIPVIEMVEIGAGGELEPFDSDELATLEAGWRQLMGAGQLELSLFATQWNHVQSDVLQPDGLIETMNVGDARIVGVEASWSRDFGEHWHVAAGGTLTEGHLYRDAEEVRLSDRSLPVVPEYTLRGEVEHRFALGRAEGQVNLRLNYLGPAHLSFDPLLDRDMGNALLSQLSARVLLGDLALGLAVENLFARNDDTFALGNRLRLFTTEQFTPVRPTTASFSVGYRF